MCALVNIYAFLRCRYVVWVSGVEVCVGRVLDELLVARTSTHERVTSLETMDHGYVLVVGRKDGHLLTMKLVVDVDDDDVTLQRYDDVPERLNRLLDRQASHVTLHEGNQVFRA